MTAIAFVDRWLTAPLPNARRRLGLFRILYALFYLWHLSFDHAARFAGLPEVEKMRVWLVAGFWPSAAGFELIEQLLVGSLLLLLFGLWVPIATWGALILGALLEAFHFSAEPEHATLFLTFYIPLFMALDPRWGDAYALHRNDLPESWRHVWQTRACLLMLAVLFTTSGVMKVVGDGLWLERPALVAHVMAHRSILAASLGLPVNPLVPLLSESSTLATWLRFHVIVLEGGFLLALVNLHLRRVYLCNALLFHSANALFAVVTFTPILIVYAIFVDWEALLGRRIIVPKLTARARRALTVVAAALAVAVASSWNSFAIVRDALGCFGLIDLRTIWYPVLPIALIGLIRSLLGAGRALARGRQRA